MNKKGRSPTEVTQVSTCAILQYEQTRPFSHGSDSSKYMYYLTIWTKKAVSPTEVTQVSTLCYLTIWTKKAVLPLKWLKWVHVLSYNMNKKGRSPHWSDSSKYMYYLTIWTNQAVLPRKWLKWVHVLSYNMNKPGRSPTEVTQVSTCTILQYEHQAVLSHGSDSSEYMCYLTIWTNQAVLPRKWLK